VRTRRLKQKDGTRADGVVVEPRTDRPPAFDVLEISPGTDFSRKLGAALVQWAEKRCRRNAAQPFHGFASVVVSDAQVPGDGELKCVESRLARVFGRRARGGETGSRERYLDALARHAARPEDVVIYGGDADLVVLALCRARDGAGALGDALRSLLVVSDVGKVVDIGLLADALVDDAPRGVSRRQVCLDFVTLAVMAGGNDYVRASLARDARCRKKKNGA